MKTERTLIISLVLCILISSCAPPLVPFTQQLRQQYKLQPEELRSIQFYFSNTFVLRRGENNDMKDTKHGELTVMSDSKIEEIIIKAGTPCIIRDVIDGNQVSITFEDDGNKYLVFGSISNNDGYYTLRAMDWKNGKGTVNYGEKIYYSSQGSKDVFLALKMKSLKRFDVDQKVVKGAVLD